MDRSKAETTEEEGISCYIYKMLPENANFLEGCGALSQTQVHSRSSIYSLKLNSLKQLGARPERERCFSLLTSDRYEPFCSLCEHAHN